MIALFSYLERRFFARIFVIIITIFRATAGVLLRILGVGVRSIQIVSFGFSETAME